jgi:hypothetical protein
VGLEKAYMGWTTISGYNTTSGIVNVTPIDELVVTVPLAGEQATAPYHLVRYDQMITASSGVSDHGLLTGLLDDDHTQYILVNGSRGFTNTVSGISPVMNYDLTTKGYVDDEIANLLSDAVTITGTQTVTGDKTFDNTLTTFLGDVFFDGITITLSGTTFNTESSAVFNYDNTSTINNEGDTNYLTGSTVTFSGTTVFETETVFNADVTYGNNTISGTGDIYAGNVYSDNIIDSSKKWGRETVISGAVSQAVVFSNAFPSSDYTLIATLTNEVDSPPSIYSTIQGIKTSGGFTTYFSGEIDSANFVLEWYAFKGTQDLA